MFIQRPNEAGQSLVRCWFCVGRYLNANPVLVMVETLIIIKFRLKLLQSINSAVMLNWGGSIGYQWTIIAIKGRAKNVFLCYVTKKKHQFTHFDFNGIKALYKLSK
ncbi:hypothetical protein [Haemophilus parainfluenzae]|uniref:hypothetical protein n=1 Tax=Haemophilus parainfluenzae TaxID=729 RepID=UPI0018A446F1|nr:hypothetical protein [Haemophilus parainfluenzae]QOR24266.1 hypothetical protein INP90_07320 [Haemophilus parainfluenzae]